MPRKLVPYNGEMISKSDVPLALIVEEADDATDPVLYLYESAEVLLLHIIFDMETFKIIIYFLQSADVNTTESASIVASVVEKGECLIIISFTRMTFFTPRAG